MSMTAEEWIYSEPSGNNDSKVETTPTTPTDGTVAEDKSESKPSAPKEPETPKETPKEAPKEGTPKAALSNDVQKREHAFAALKHRMQSKVDKLAKERDSIKKELEDLKANQKNAGYVEQQFIQRDIKALEKQANSIDSQIETEKWESSNEAAYSNASNILNDEQMAEYEQIVGNRSALYAQLDRIAPVMSNILQDPECKIAPLIELALAQPPEVANQILKALNDNSYRKCNAKLEAYAQRLLGTDNKQETLVTQETKPEVVKPKISTPSVAPKQTTDAKMSDIPDLATVSSWF